MGEIKSHLLQYLTSILGGLLLAFETSLDYFIPCLLAIALDVFTAYMLCRRVHKKYPDKSDGKFKSEYKYRVMITMGVVFILMILAAYVDMKVRMSDDQLAVRAAMGAFLFYEGWSCLENWSSENDEPIAKALQRYLLTIFSWEKMGKFPQKSRKSPFTTGIRNLNMMISDYEG